MTRGFSPLGRETFATDVEWVDGWPVMAPVVAMDVVNAPTFDDDFDDPALGPEWIAVRRFPADLATVSDGALTLRGEGRTMDHPAPTFVGRRQRRLDARISTTVEHRGGVGGLTMRYDEDNHYDLEIDGDQLVARAHLPTIVQEHRADLPAGPISLYVECIDPPAEFGAGMTSDVIRLGYEDAAGNRHEVTAFDGRFLSAESACSFTGRAAGVYCVIGELVFSRYREDGTR